jgi:large subunit ribosomal protein LX
MKAFLVSGKFKISERNWQNFNIEVASGDENAAREKIMTILGSRHKVPRRLIDIQKVQELDSDKITDNVVKHQAGAGS